MTGQPGQLSMWVVTEYFVPQGISMVRYVLVESVRAELESPFVLSLSKHCRQGLRQAQAERHSPGPSTGSGRTTFAKAFDRLKPNGIHV
ncbi:MAG: hypothetical protein VR73_01630 [Gammaproteobacteria bacterium BRH_c0]|nr:MAG: hypothetical protein VR73_01630 [Gammaproteobacteria bacterium BRH_c0]